GVRLNPCLDGRRLRTDSRPSSDVDTEVALEARLAISVGGGSGFVLDRRGGRLSLHQLDAVLAVGLGHIALAAVGDDLAVRRPQAPAEFASFVLVDLKRSHGMVLKRR